MQEYLSNKPRNDTLLHPLLAAFELGPASPSKVVEGQLDSYGGIYLLKAIYFLAEACHTFPSILLPRSIVAIGIYCIEIEPRSKMRSKRRFHSFKSKKSC